MYKLIEAEHLGAFEVDGYGLIPKEELTQNHLANMYTGGSQYVTKEDVVKEATKPKDKATVEQSTEPK